LCWCCFFGGVCVVVGCAGVLGLVCVGVGCLVRVGVCVCACVCVCAHDGEYDQIQNTHTDIQNYAHAFKK